VRVSSLFNSIDKRYLTVSGACLTQFTIVGFLFAYGLFFKSFEVEYGWSRTLLSSCLSFAFLVMGVLASFGGHLSDRYGPRRVLAVTGTMCGIGFILLSQVTQPWQLFVFFGLLVGLGLATHDVVTLSTIARQFHRRRGMMTGVVKVGTATGQIIIPPVAAFLMAVYDWRLALIILGCAAIALLIFAATLIQSPAPSKDSGHKAEVSGSSIREVRGDRKLWMICAIQFSFFTSLTTIPLHIVVHGMDLGMTATVAASLLSVMGAASIAGRLTVGTLVDRIGGRRAMMLCLVPLIASLLVFPSTSAMWLVFVGVVIYGFGHGGLFTVMSPTVAEYFGLKAHGAIFGIVVFFGTIGGASGPILAGRIFDLTGSYTLAFIALAALATFGMILVLKLPAPSSSAQH
jgi:MFS family permease